MVNKDNKYITSRSNGHTHTWSEKNKNTSYDFGHSHPIDLKRMIAKKGKSNHIHKLLKGRNKR